MDEKRGQRNATSVESHAELIRAIRNGRKQWCRDEDAKAATGPQTKPAEAKFFSRRECDCQRPYENFHMA